MPSKKYKVIMIEANNPEINVEELLEKIKEEVARRNTKFQPLTSNTVMELSSVNLTLNNIEALLRNAESRSSVRNKWPDRLNRFPLNLTKDLQKISLKILNFIFKDQREVNLNLIATLRETITVNRKLALEVQTLQSQLENLNKKLGDPLEKESRIKENLDAFYVAFEDRFRGSREDILERLKVYLPSIEKANAGQVESPILDIGCGRGEWLELLRDSGLKAKGIDINRIAIEHCMARGLEVVESDVVTYLQSLPDGSVGAITGFHIIEHLQFRVLIKLIQETLRVLRPGGIVIFETPNPQNVLVGTNNFYMDPTHLNPLPNLLVKFLLEYIGLSSVEILHLNPYNESFAIQGSEIADIFNKYFYGPQDYGAIGYKI